MPGNNQGMSLKNNGDENLNENPAVLVTESRQWFRDQYKKMTMLCTALAILSALSITLSIVQYIFKPTPQYFAQTPDLRITEMKPLSEPYITQEGITEWALGRVKKTLSLGFTDWRVKLSEVQPDFFEKAFSDFVMSMKDQGTLDLIESKRLVMNTSAKTSPVVSAKGLTEDGAMSWKIEFPITISYESSQGIFLNQALDVAVLVERVSVLDNQKGVKIRQLILKPSKPNTSR
jgi:intracellular multiplication protein IcmL